MIVKSNTPMVNVVIKSLHCMTEYDLLWRIVYSVESLGGLRYTPDVRHVTPNVHQRYTNSLEH